MQLFSLVKGPIFAYDKKTGSTWLQRFFASCCFCFDPNQYEVPAKKRILTDDWLSSVDIVVVAIDLLCLVLILVLELMGSDPTVGKMGKNFSKIIKVLRAFRLVKATRALRLVDRVYNPTDSDEIEWELPMRYALTAELQMKTMLQTVNVLREITKMTRDYSLSLMMTNFKLWETGKIAKTPFELFDECFNDIKEGKLSKLGCGLALDSNMKDFDLVFLDLCLYEYPELVQAALNVMMTHHNLRFLMKEDFVGSQLLVKPADEEKAKDLRRDLTQLQSYAERAELWAELETPEDRETNIRVQTILKELASACRVRTSKLKGSKLFRPEPPIQDMLRNLGAFEVACTVLELKSSLTDDPDDEVSNNIQEILRLCNVFVSWFCMHNDANQELAYGHMDEIFMDSLDDNIGAHLVVAETFRGNEKLVKAFPTKWIGFCADSLAKRNDPNYLDVLDALVWQPKHDAPNNTEKQFAIIKELTDVKRIDAIMYTCADPESEEYQERKNLVQEAMRNMESQPLEDSDYAGEYAHMPPFLEYHVKLLQVMSGTAVGRTDITTVEAKLQTLYKPDDQLIALLDPDSTLDIKIPIASLFYRAVIEVEIAVPGLGKSVNLWKFMKECVGVFNDSIQDLRSLSENPREISLESVVSRRKCDYMLQCALIVGGFFEKYHDASIIPHDFFIDEDTAAQVAATLRNAEQQFGNAGDGEDEKIEDDEDDDDRAATPDPGALEYQRMWWDDLIANLLRALTAIYEEKPPILQRDSFALLYESIENITSAISNADQMELELSRPEDLGSVCESIEEHTQVDFKDTTEKWEEELKFDEFCNLLGSDTALKTSINEDKKAMVLSLNHHFRHLQRRSDGA
jgi:hypothetical protein